MKGQYLYWYMVLDVFSRKIVAHEVYEEESAQHALRRRADGLGICVIGIWTQRSG